MSTRKVLFHVIAASALAAFAIWSGCGDNKVTGIEGYTLTTGALPPAGGSVSVDYPQKSYEAGASVNVTALANPGYKFVEWSEASTSVYQNVTVIMNGNKTLIAHFNYIAGLQKSVTVTFNTSGGVPGAISAITIESGSALGARFPANPAKEGFDFSVWFDADGVQYTAQTLITKDVALTAGWVKQGQGQAEAPQYTVSFNANGGTPSAIGSVTVDSGGMIGTDFPVPTKTGHIFGGWFDGAAQYTASTVITRDAALTAAWKVEEKNFTVSFDANGGSPSIIGSVTVANGMALGTGTPSLPADPAKVGNAFGGWFDNAAGERYTASTVIVKDVTLTAKWTPEPSDTAVNPVKPPDCSATGKCLTVAFDADGGSPSMISSVKVDSGKTLGSGAGQLPADPVKSGYYFGGWFDDPAGVQYTASTVVTKDVTLKARWTPADPNKPAKRFTVSFDTDGGSPSMMGSVTVDSGKALGTGIGLPASNPTKQGYIFGGWYDGATQYKTNTIITQDVMLTAMWTVKSVTVSFDVNGGSPSAINPVALDSGAALGAQFPAPPTMEGHTFAGWFYGGNRYMASTAIDRNLTLTAEWKARNFTVSFNTNGGNPNVIGSVSVDSGKALGTGMATGHLPTDPTKSGFTFGGWFSGAQQYYENTAITEDLRLTARWIPRYAVSFDANGGSPRAINYVVVDSGSALGADLPTVAMPGYPLSGWFDGKEQYTSSTAVTKNVTLKAIWTFSGPTVKIGNQTWMKYNLDYVTDSSWCYNDCSNNYGRLYQWSDAVTACQVFGWHLPTLDEWQELLEYVGGSSTAASKLKSTGGWYDHGSGTDNYRFSAVPGGKRSGSRFDGIYSYGYWWSSTIDPSNGRATGKSMSSTSDETCSVGGKLGMDGYSVRCIKD